jgi:hypothetical protein
VNLLDQSQRDPLGGAGERESSRYHHTFTALMNGLSIRVTGINPAGFYRPRISPSALFPAAQSRSVPDVTPATALVVAVVVQQTTRRVG